MKTPVPAISALAFFLVIACNVQGQLVPDVEPAESILAYHGNTNQYFSLQTDGTHVATLQDGGGTVLSTGSIVVSQSPAVSSNVSVFVPLAHTPSYGGLGGAQFNYFFSISGPTPTVQIDAHAFGFVFVGPTLPDGISSDLAFANLYVSALDPVAASDTLSGLGARVQASHSDPQLNYGGIVTNDTDLSGSFTINQTVTASTNVVYEVSMSAETDAFDNAFLPNSDAPISFFSLAEVDPTFKVSSSLVDPDNYIITFSRGLSSPVPEPSSYGWFGIALVTFVAHVRHFRTRPQV